jgi:signal peptidase II
MRPLWWGGAAAVVALDQLSKWLALAFLTGKGPVGILPCLNFTLVYNRGAAFGFLSQASGWQNAFFIVVALLASAYVIYLLRRLDRGNRWTAAGLVLILGGALGNLIDRLVHGHVLDFIDVYYGAWHWPAFNIADSAITIGAVLLIWDAVGASVRSRRAASVKR